MKKEYEIISNSRNFPLNALLVRLFKRTPHLHKEIEVGLIVKGSLELILADSSSRLCGGDVYVLNPMDIHSFSAAEEDVTILAVQFPRRLLTPLYNRSSAEFSGNVIKDESTARRVRELLVELAYHYFSRTPGFEYKCMSILNMVCYMAEQALPLRDLVDDKRYQSSRRLMRIVDYIEQHYTQKLLLSDVARQEGLSLTYLSHLFKENFKMSFQEYLTFKRLRYARGLLADTDRSILDISNESGFSDPRYLNAACERYYNCSAADLRHGNGDSANEPPEVKYDWQFFFSSEEAVSLLTALREANRKENGELSVRRLYDW